MISRKEKNDILLQLPYHDTWRQQVNENLVLQEAHKFVPGRYASSSGLSKIGEQLEPAELFLDFLLNGGSHRVQRTLIKVACHFDLIILVLFPLILPKLQEAILSVLKHRGAILLKAIFGPLMLSN